MPKLTLGDPAPWFTARSTVNPQFRFDSIAGRYVVLCFFGSAADPASRAVLDAIERVRDRFDDENCCFFGVSTDPNDELLGRVQQHLPGIRYFWDFDQHISRLYGAVSLEHRVGYQRFTIVLDFRLRTLAAFPFGDDPHRHAAAVLEFLKALPLAGPPVPAAIQAPILVVPNIFEPEFCRELIGLYEQHGGSDSGFMRDRDGKTVGVIDYSFKRRMDYTITDESVRRKAMFRIHDRLAPEIHKAFQFRATRMERYIVACYEGETGGHFRAHRDNTTRGTAHRRFAVSLNLNTGEYEGGQVRFPEFGPHLYAAPAGGAVVFSCSLLHEAMPVTRGRRYVFLPFLYDEEAARIREQNQRFLDTGPPEYHDPRAAPSGTMA